MKTSQIAAKIATRLFLILLLVALVALMSDKHQLDHIYISKQKIWTFIAPVLLIMGFMCLLVICARQKYSKPDLNWLLVINTVVLMAYGIALFVRIYQLINHQH